MNAFVKKEIRLLLPSFLIGLALAFSILLVPKNQPGSNWQFLFALPMVCCPAMIVMMSLDSIGRELAASTLTNLLVQPVSRGRIWWIKSGLLFAALVIVFAAWWVSFLLGWPAKISVQETREMLLATAIFVITVYSGGLWTVLLLRQVAVAFWLTLLIPAAIMLVFVNLLAEKHPEQLTPVVVTALFIYSIAGFLFAWRLFLRAQDVQWTGATISLPQWRFLPSLLIGTGAKRGRRPLAAMVAREFQFHQSQLVIAGGLALLHLGVLVARAIGHGFKQHPTVEFILGQFWCLWFALPLLIGCAAVAEERKLGTLEGELCLSVRRRTQFATKLGVVLLLSILLGTVMPLLLEGTRILPDTHLGANVRSSPDYFALIMSRTFGIIFHWLVIISDWLGLLMFAAICAGIGAVSFYFSTLSRHTMQALGLGLLGIFATVFLWVAAFMPERFIGCVPWRGLLVYLIGLPTLTLALAWLAYWNYKRVLVGWPAWRRNLLTLLAALTFAITSTSALYHRVWELAAPLEPAHGPARLVSARGVAMQINLGSLTVGLPDGRVWLDRFTHSVPSFWGLLMNDSQIQFSGGWYLEGTNWASVVTRYPDTVGIQSDGSLWVSEKPESPITYRQQGQSPIPARLVRFGKDNDWKSVVGYSQFPLLLKNDGTLWLCTMNDFKRSGQDGPGLRAFEPRRLGTDSDWADMIQVGISVYLWKNNGHAWAKNPIYMGPMKARVELAPGFEVETFKDFDNIKWRSMAQGQPFQMGVRENGTLWAWGLMPRIFKDPNVASGQFGNETNWVSVACNETIVVALKADGSLWKWSFEYNQRPNANAAIPVRLGTHNDWVAVAGSSDGVETLAADGSLWLWRFDPSYFFRSRELPVNPLIGVSRKPQRIAGVFDKAE